MSRRQKLLSRKRTWMEAFLENGGDLEQLKQRQSKSGSVKNPNKGFGSKKK